MRGAISDGRPYRDNCAGAGRIPTYSGGCSLVAFATAPLGSQPNVQYNEAEQSDPRANLTFGQLARTKGKQLGNDGENVGKRRSTYYAVQPLRDHLICRIVRRRSV